MIHVEASRTMTVNMESRAAIAKIARNWGWEAKAVGLLEKAGGHDLTTSVTRSSDGLSVTQVRRSPEATKKDKTITLTAKPVLSGQGCQLTLTYAFDADVEAQWIANYQREARRATLYMVDELAQKFGDRFVSADVGL